MITTVTLNAAIDKTYYVGQFEAGRVHRVGRQIAEPGGKGNNVAKVARLLGAKVTATGYIAGMNGAFIEGQLQLRDIETAFVNVPGESRICLNIIDEGNGQSTELLEQGPAIGESHLQELKDTLGRLAQRSGIVAFSGSLPPGAPSGFYAELIEIVQSAGARAYLDTSGKALQESLGIRPHLIKPNEDELAQWLGRDNEELTEQEYIDAAFKLASEGISQVCVTLGSRGTIAIIDGTGYRAIPPTIQAVNTVGCGDSFVAGMAYGEQQGMSPAERLRTATAAAAANAMSEKAGHIDDELFQSYAAQVQVAPL